ncbi:MAG: alkaline phosphatase D family protein [Luteimonas sp.]
MTKQRHHHNAIALSNQLLRDGRVSRRDVLRASLSLAGLSLLAPLARAQQARTRFVDDPFTLGVASGYPAADGITLWTRLAPQPLQADGGIGRDEMLAVTWQVADDEGFGRIVAEGRKRAVSELAHSVHVDVRGLRPGRNYFYRFIVGDAVSAVGRTHTAPAIGTTPERLRFAIGSCQHYEQGYFNAYRHIVDDAPDLMVFLGDYIYESSWGDDPVRRHSTGEPYALDEYRVRHAQYKSDADLQRAHAAMPWLLTWDDHEVDNDLAGEQSEHLDPRFLQRRAAAYQAYYEHLPIPDAMRPDVHGGMRIYTEVAYGELARFFILDDRQYRTPQPCPDAFKGGGSTTVDTASCAALDDRAATMLGVAQERWLTDGLSSTRARWNVIAQQTLMTAKDDDPGPGKKVWTDGWDGYPRSRELIYDAIEQQRVSNPLVVGGDIHATVLADLKRAPWDAGSPILGSEICGTSISSQGAAQAEYDARLAANPQIRYARGDRRGYCLLTLGRDARVDVRAVASVKQRETSVETLTSVSIADGRPGLQQS